MPSSGISSHVRESSRSGALLLGIGLAASIFGSWRGPEKLHAADLEARAGIPDDRNLPRNLRIVLENTQPLSVPRGNRLPLYILPLSNLLRGMEDSASEEILRQLDRRGIAMTVDWDYRDREKSLTEGLRVARLQQKLGLAVNANANACLCWFFNGDERTAHVDESGKSFFDDSFATDRPIGCPFSVEFRYAAIKEQVEFFLRGYKKGGVPLDFVFADWEIDGPMEWNGAWACSRRCRRCRARMDNVSNFECFQRTVREIRAAMQRTVLAENVLHYFPRAMVGNYGVFPDDGYRYWYDYFEKPVEGAPTRRDQNARYRAWFPEFELTKYTCAMPVVYTWYPIFQWYDFPDPDYRWFYNLLLAASSVAPHRKSPAPIISFVHWTTTAPPESPDPSVRQFSRVKYQELLRHMLLRGHDTFFLWCQERELADEVRLVHEVYSESLDHRKYLAEGTPINFDVPRRPGAVISGVRRGGQVLVRRTDFSDRAARVDMAIDGWTVSVPPAEGRWQILEPGE